MKYCTICLFAINEPRFIMQFTKIQLNLFIAEPLLFKWAYTRLHLKLSKTFGREGNKGEKLQNSAKGHVFFVLVL